MIAIQNLSGAVVAFGGRYTSMNAQLTMIALAMWNTVRANVLPSEKFFST